MPLGDGLKLRGELFIELRDKRTGALKKRIHEKNAVLVIGASKALDVFTVGGTYNKDQYVYLYDSNKALIKSLTGTWGTKTDTGSSVYNELEAKDESNDSYTVAYLGLSDQDTDPGYENNNFAYKPSEAITKGASDTLTIRWRITVSYSSPPS